MLFIVANDLEGRPTFVVIMPFCVVLNNMVTGTRIAAGQPEHITHA